MIRLPNILRESDKAGHEPSARPLLTGKTPDSRAEDPCRYCPDSGACPAPPGLLAACRAVERAKEGLGQARMRAAEAAVLVKRMGAMNA